MLLGKMWGIYWEHYKQSLRTWWKHTENMLGTMWNTMRTPKPAQENPKTWHPTPPTPPKTTNWASMVHTPHLSIVVYHLISSQQFLFLNCVLSSFLDSRANGRGMNCWDLSNPLLVFSSSKTPPYGKYSKRLRSPGAALNSQYTVGIHQRGGLFAKL